MQNENLNSIPLQSVIDHFKLESVVLPDDISDRVITSRDVTRPGLPLNGFFDHYDSTRIAIIGNAEHQFL